MSGTALSPKSWRLAAQLLACEAAGNHPAGSPTPVAFRVAEKLRYSLSRLAGEAGFRAILSRALTLAKAQAPGLRAVQVQADGTLQWGSAEINSEPEAGTLLIAQLLELLVTFIGEPLTLRLLQDVWPELPYHDEAK